MQQQAQLDNVQDPDFEQQQIEEPEQLSQEQDQGGVEYPKRRRQKKTAQKDDHDDDSELQQSYIFDDNAVIDRLPQDKNMLQSLLSQVKQKIKDYKQIFLKQQQSSLNNKSYVGDNAIPICADVRYFDFQKLLQKQKQIASRQFDVIMMDPPWRLSSSQPSRGVAIQYCSLGDQAIEQIPVPTLQKQGFIFIWVINAKFQWTVNIMQKKWGYKVIDNINWVKKTVNGKIAKGHGFYLQHAKQTCLVGIKGNPTMYNRNIASDVIFSYRRGQSQKPTQIYEYIEKLVPNGYYLQIFGRRNNLRNNWVTIGNEL